jgi:hypothetical protein
MTYGWKCRCGEELFMEVIRLKSIPECFICGEKMFMMYSINEQGSLWMNKALLLEESYE